MHKLHAIVAHIPAYVRHLLSLSAHPESGWTAIRSLFLVQFVVALMWAGDVMLSAVVRKMPSRGVAMKHRYKTVDRMLGEVDVTPVAAQQTAELGQQVGPGWVIALDLSDIAKPNARAMPYLHKVHDGSTGAIVQGYRLATAVAVDLFGQQKRVPLPLNFEVFSAAEEDFKSQPAVWLEMIDRISAATKHGTFVLDREGDNRRIIDRFVDRKRDFVLRVNTHEHSRLVLFGKSSRARVMDAWKEAEFYGEPEARRLHATAGVVLTVPTMRRWR